MLLAVVPDGELATSHRRLALTVAVVTVLAIVAVAALVFLALNRLVLWPLSQLGRQAAAIGEGRFDVPSPVTSDDELGDLARAFRKMSERLRGTLEELRGSHARIEELAYRDSLTGLPNRRLFLDLLGEALREADERGERVALLFLDLDDFKRVNDTLGHDKGDELLCEGARRLGACAGRAVEELARRATWAGTSSRCCYPCPATTRRSPPWRSAWSRPSPAPVLLGGRELSVGSSVGVAVYPDDADSIDALMRCADAAMYEAKRRGKNMWCRFDAAMQAELERTLQLESDLRAAVLDPGDTQLHLHYQPQLDVATGTFTGVEALLRWEHPRARTRSAGPLRADRRTHRPDRQPGPTCARRCLRAVAALAGGGARLAARGGQRLPAPVRARRRARRGGGGSRRDGACRPPCSRWEVTEKLHDRGAAGGHRDAPAPAGELGGAGGDGRLSGTGALLARRAARAADRHAEDRPQLRLGAGTGRAQGRDRADGADTRPHARGSRRWARGSRPKRSSPSLRESGCHLAQGVSDVAAVAGEEATALLLGAKASDAA